MKEKTNECIRQSFNEHGREFRVKLTFKLQIENALYKKFTTIF